MQAVGIILVLINVFTIVTPFAVVMVTYQSDFSGLVVPPQIMQLMNETFPSGLEFKLPTFVGATIDNISRTITFTVNFSNPLNYNLTLKEVSSDVVCREHNFTLGHAEIIGNMVIPANETVQISVVCTWTQIVESHFLITHADETTLQVNIQDLSLNVNDVTLEVPKTIELPFDISISAVT
jgi:hypothetical protein